MDCLDLIIVQWPATVGPAFGFERLNMNIHVCKCEYNKNVEYHLRYPGMTEHEAQDLADKINAQRYTAPTVNSPAIVNYMKCDGDKESSALERLRFFCSLAINATDWLDCERFFKDVSEQIESCPKKKEHYTADYGLTAEQLSRKYNLENVMVVEHPDNTCGTEHPGYCRWDWLQDIQCNHTKLGYWSWVSNELKEEEKEHNAQKVKPNQG